MSETSGPEPIIYREEVVSILWALADLVVDVRGIRRQLGDDDDEEEEQEGDR